MSVTREIITIQAGNFSNFIGTHWWNSQESSFNYDAESSASLEINHDLLFREGLNLQGEVTYTPRLILIDLDSNLKSIRKECPLYRNPGEDKHPTLWDGTVDIVQEEATKTNPFLEDSNKANISNTEPNEQHDISQIKQDFDSTDTRWSDFLRTSLHPKSFCLFNECDTTDEKNPFDLFSYGEDLWKASGSEMIEDSMRRMTEECDYLQGFHILFDSHNAFSGVSQHVLQFIDDEYKRKTVLCFPTFQDDARFPIQDMNKQMHRLYAVLQSLNNMISFTTIFSPLSMFDDVVQLPLPPKTFPFLHYDASFSYHTSAIFAMAIETFTSSYRLKNPKFNMADMSSAMSTYGRKLVASSTSLPFPLRPDQFLTEMFEKDVSELYMTSLTPFYKPDLERTLFQSAVLRGIPESKFQNSKKTSHLCSKEEVFGGFLNKYSPSSLTTATVINEKCTVSTPFPNIFKIADPLTGLLNTCATLNSNGLDKVPVAAALSSSDSAASFIEDLISQSNKKNFKIFTKCTETSYDRDMFLEVIENLTNFQECYQNYL